MRRARWKFWLLILALTAVPTYGDEDVDLLIAYLLDALDSSQTVCAESRLAEYAGQRLVCGDYDHSFSGLKFDWEQVMRHSRLPLPLSTEGAWTYRDGAFRSTYTYGGGDSELQVAFVPNDESLQFAYLEADVDSHARAANAGPLDLGDNPVPRMAGFGGVSIPKLIEESRVEPLRSTRARAERVAGTATLEIVVQTDGTVRDVVVLSAAPAGYDFDVSALDAVRQWTFAPALFEGQPIDAVLNLTVEIKHDPPPPGDD
ncbi:MAG: energy transducer TonB [Acidobacteria bacterium]|nr:energy transducer TonB [Acidobacteriota bacterium]